MFWFKEKRAMRGRTGYKSKARCMAGQNIRVRRDARLDRLYSMSIFDPRYCGAVSADGVAADSAIIRGSVKLYRPV